MRTVSLPAGRHAAPLAPKRLLGVRGDDYLVEQIRRGNEGAFEAAYERYGGSILSFCRHMLGSREEAEDAVQHTFASAYRDLLRNGRPVKLKPWLYTIARNRCLSVLRARREEAAEELEVATVGLDEQVGRRAELRELLHDLDDLPEEQRTALLLAELGALSHPQVAQVLDCEVPRVKALVFRARAGLMERREARETPCAEIQEQLANLRGGALRRSALRYHLRGCAACRSFRQEVRRQRAMLAVVLPVTPSAGLKSSVLAAAGVGGGPSGGAAGAGLGLSSTSLPSSTVAKIAAVCALAGAGVIASGGLIGGSKGDTGAGTRGASASGQSGERGGEGLAGARSGWERARRLGADNRRTRRSGRSPAVSGRRKAGRRAPGTRRRRGDREAVAPLSSPGAPGSAPGTQTPPTGGSGGKPPSRSTNSPPNPSPKARGRGIPQSAPPATPPAGRHGDDVRQTPPPGHAGARR